MKKRYLYSILFGIPGFFVSGLISLAFFGAAAGVLWIFVFGDDPWPPITDVILPVLLAFVFLSVWLAAVTTGFVIGKHLKSNPIVNKKHILVSLFATLIPLLFIVLYMVSVGNIGAKSDSVRCSDYCSQKGYSASVVSPQYAGEVTCGCIDNSGQEKIKVPVDTINLPK